MFQKISLLIFLFFLMNNSVISVLTLNKYSSLITSISSSFLLTTSGFSVGEDIYIKIVAKNGGYCINGLDYAFFESKIGNYYAEHSITSHSRSSTTVNGFTEETFYYTIEKTKSRGNYLYMELHCTGEILIENTKEDESLSSTIGTIVAIVCSIIALIIIIIIIICCCRTCRRNRAAIGGVGYVTPIGYGVSPYSIPPVVGVRPIQPMVAVQPMQPVVNIQPYGQNYQGAPGPNYVQAPLSTPYSSLQAQGSSSNRMEQFPKYEKPIA